jgi:hypothetical protein
MSSDANPVKELGPSPGSRKPLGQDLPTIFVPESIGVVVGIKGEGVMQKMSLSAAEAKGFINVEYGPNNLFGACSDMTVKILSSRVRLAVFTKPV